MRNCFRYLLENKPGADTRIVDDACLIGTAGARLPPTSVTTSCGRATSPPPSPETPVAAPRRSSADT